MMKQYLRQGVDGGIFRSVDVQLAYLLTQNMASPQRDTLLLLMTWLSQQAGMGHVCVDVNTLTLSALVESYPREKVLLEQIWLEAHSPETEDFYEALKGCSAVSHGDKATPLVLEGHRLYLQRMWADETFVAHCLLQRCRQPVTEFIDIKAILDLLFVPQAEIDWQKIAVAIAVTRQLAIISGGPGTGKTTTVAKLLAALILSSPEPLKIVLAAPTGKAAARLSESLQNALANLPLSEEQKRQVPKETQTLHRLLGAIANSRRFRHNQLNPIHAHVVIVDEASMIDLPLMASLMDALSDNCKLILLGDKEQLASVEAGSVLGDLCDFAQYGYGESANAMLRQLTEYLLPQEHQHVPILSDHICLLRKSYRFVADAGIGQLALAINQGKVSQALHCFKQYTSDLHHQSLVSKQDYLMMIEACVDGYQHYLSGLSVKAVSELLQQFNQFQVLCALRDGPFGVVGLNQNIEKRLIERKLIERRSSLNTWYAGRPVMILRNDSQLGLYNGDTGLAAFDEQGKLLVYFRLANGEIKGFSPHRLPEHETAFAMTVHKSQGSEFEKVLFVLPDTFSPLLTRELVYTAVTRAKLHLTLYGLTSILSQAITTLTKRQSGLEDKLHNFIP